MKPLQEESLSQVGRLRKENDFQGTRRSEIREFWKAGCKLAELQVSGKVSLDREIELYKRAIRQVGYEMKFDWMRDIKMHKRQGKIIAERKAK